MSVNTALKIILDAIVSKWKLGKIPSTRERERERVIDSDSVVRTGIANGLLSGLRRVVWWATATTAALLSSSGYKSGGWLRKSAETKFSCDWLRLRAQDINRCGLVSRHRNSFSNPHSFPPPKIESSY